jgi:hypothetical protein
MLYTSPEEPQSSSTEDAAELYLSNETRLVVKEATTLIESMKVIRDWAEVNFKLGVAPYYVATEEYRFRRVMQLIICMEPGVHAMAWGNYMMFI